MARLNVNGTNRDFEAEPDTPLLWVLREQLGLTGTKYGCGIAVCGACTVHVDGRPARSCQLRIGEVGAAEITTIEGIAQGGQLHAVQRAWIEEDVPSCGYCQSGQVMAAVALLAQTAQPNDAEVEAAMDNICRCGTYPRIRRAIARAAQELGGTPA